MKLAGFLLLLSGWGIAMIAIAILPSGTSRLAFFLAGMGVEAIGLVVAVRSHFPQREDHG
jgi:hypothetical protein